MSLLIVRALGPSGRGAYYVPITLVTVAYYFANLGTDQAQYRLWSRREVEGSQLFANSFFLAAALGALAAVASFIVFHSFADSAFAGIQSKHIYIALTALPFLIHSLLLTGLLVLRRHLPVVNRAALITAAVQCAGVGGLWSVGHLTVESVLVLFVAAAILQWILLLTPLLSLFGFVRASSAVLLRQLRLGVILMPYVILAYLNLRLDVFFVSRYRGLAAVGFYSVAVVFAELVWLATDSLSTVVTERQANARSREAHEVTQLAVRMNLLIAAVLAVAIAVAAWPLVPLLYGDRFSVAVEAIWILLPGATAMALWRTVGAINLREGGPHLQPLTAGAAVAVNVVGNVLLVPSYGIAGAAWASLISYLTGALLSSVIFIRLTDSHVSALLPRASDIRTLTGFVRNASREQMGKSRS